MWIKILLIAILCAYIVFNFVTAMCFPACRMKKDFVEGQCFVGKILTNIFYAPAWILKGLRAVVLAVIA